MSSHDSARRDAAALRARYEAHHLTEGAILDRLVRAGADLDHLTEKDLCRDPDGGITDQNHVGGASAVRALAKKVGVGPSTFVLDVGCGLGGPARLLAEECSSRVIGVDLTLSRVFGAGRLTRRVGLEGKVRFVVGDGLALPFEDDSFDVIWGQSAWVHFRDREGLLRECRRVLVPGGLVASEDPFLSAGPSGQDVTLKRLSEIWMAHIAPEGRWIDLLEELGFVVQTNEDLTSLLAREAERMARGLEGSPWNEEREAWLLAGRLVEAGRIVYARTIARK